MSTVTVLPQSRPLTYDDLASMPDDGHRYELLDGTLVVTPAPGTAHQSIVVALARLLSAAQPEHLQTFVAPLDVVLANDTVVQPDVLVARRSDLTTRNLPAAPVLAVEVLSPSTARVDRWLKAARYAAAGIEHYWIIDPEKPSLTAFRVAGDGTYEQVDHVTGADAFEADEPFAVSLVPSALLRG